MTQSQPDAATLADPGSRSTEFVPVQGGNDTTSAESLLIAAYVLMWALVFGFIFLSWRRQGRVESRIGELEKALEAGASKGSRGN